MNETIPSPPPSAPPASDPHVDGMKGFGLLGFEAYRRQVLAAQGLSPMDLGVQA